MSRARTVAAIVDAVESGDATSEQIAAESQAAWEQSDRGETPLNAFLAFGPRTAQDHRGPLGGVPIAVKDNIVTTDFDTTCGSRILEGYRSPFDATAVRRLREAGATIVGKTNLDEFGMGSSTEYSAYGPTRNPLDPRRVPGGSSGGSAAAVAAGIVPAALGSETGGSTRQPAAFCGIVGIKPTYGRISRYGLVAYASSLDNIGVMGRTTDDAARVFQVIAGHDRFDSTSADRPVLDFSDEPAGGLDGVTIGVPEEYFPSSLPEPMLAASRKALRELEALGAEVREVSLPNTRYAIPTYYVIATAEASSNLARYDGVRYGVRPPDVKDLDELYDRTRALFGPEVKRRVMLGTYVLSAGYYDAYYGRAQRVRSLIARDFRHVFESGVDALFTPTTPTPAFRFGENTSNPYEMYLADVFTVTANLAGIPALSLPVGSVDGLPIGGQLMGRPWDEATLFRISRTLERHLADAEGKGAES